MLRIEEVFLFLFSKMGLDLMIPEIPRVDGKGRARPPWLLGNSEFH